MAKPLQDILILGGGTAGWLTAGILAARHEAKIQANQLSITLCESPNIPTIGVGEGTWPTMPKTLQSLGISEAEFFSECDASFKLGSKFNGWDRADSEDYYYHPFEDIHASKEGLTAEYWLYLQSKGQVTDKYSAMYCFSDLLANAGLGPKTPENQAYQSVVNYGYHLDAGKFSKFLTRHCTDKLGVKHVLADITRVNLTPTGEIDSVLTSKNESLTADLFIDCTGFKALLLGEALNIPFISVKDCLFADTAIATQVQYVDTQAPISSVTQSTAQRAGWIWDIALPTRRGVGHVFSSKYTDVNTATEDLYHYIEASGSSTKDLKLKEIKFNPGHRQKFWHKNCVAVGLSAGFLEPLEASALILVELSAQMIADQLPPTKTCMEISEQRFNKKFRHHWQNAINFLKLHYVLSQRDTPFWHDNRTVESIPESLLQMLELFKHKVPNAHDFEVVGELFSATNYQFVLYGNQFNTQVAFGLSTAEIDYMARHVTENQHKMRQFLKQMPTNRQLLAKMVSQA